MKLETECTLIAVGGRKQLNPQEIVLFIADANYTNIFLEDGSNLIVATPLKRLEKQFRPYRFFRTHKSYLINMAYIVEYYHATDEPYVQMQNNAKALVARRRRRVFREKIALPVL